MIDNRYWANYLYPLKPLPTPLKVQGQPRLKIAAILFDVYGTLLISASGDIDHACRPQQQNEGLINLLKRYRIHSSIADLQQRLHAEIRCRHHCAKQDGIDFPEIDIRAVWHRLLPEMDIPVLNRFAIEYELISNPIYPMPGLKFLLHACRQRQIPMGLISNAQFYTPLFLEWLLGSSLEEAGFDSELLFFSYLIHRAKPSVLLFERAAVKLAKMGKSLDSVLYIGNDMRNDIAPASRLGFKTAIFAGDRRSLRLRNSEYLFRDIQPDIILKRLMELETYLR